MVFLLGNLRIRLLIMRFLWASYWIFLNYIKTGLLPIMTLTFLEIYKGQRRLTRSPALQALWVTLPRCSSTLPCCSSTLPCCSSLDIINNFFFKVQLDNRIVHPLRSSEVKSGDNFAPQRSQSDKKSEISGGQRIFIGRCCSFRRPLVTKVYK